MLLRGARVLVEPPCACISPSGGWDGKKFFLAGSTSPTLVGRKNKKGFPREAFLLCSAEPKSV